MPIEKRSEESEITKENGESAGMDWTSIKKTNAEWNIYNLVETRHKNLEK